MGFDINSIDVSEAAEAGAWMDVYHPNGGLIDGFRLHLRGTDGATFRKQMSRLAEKYQNKRKLSPEQAVEKACELLAALTIGWEGLEEDGKPLKYSFAAAKDLYMKHSWLREQVDVFVADRGNFLATG